MISIRRVDPDKHAETITRLHEAAFDATADAVPPLVGAWWLAYDEGVPVAFAASKPSEQWTDAVYLSRCGVAPSHRGKGLQRRLIRVRELAARRAGVTWIVTDTRQNPASSNNLIKAGYLLYEPAKPWSFPDALYWKKNLKRAN